MIATAVVQAPNDKQQIAPMLEKIDALSEQFGRPETLLADNGYFSEANVTLCAAANIEPLLGWCEDIGVEVVLGQPRVQRRRSLAAHARGSGIPMQ